MKLVKEHINEKFKPDSDPIEDMGIGATQIIKKARNKIIEEADNPPSTEYKSSFPNRDWYITSPPNIARYDGDGHTCIIFSDNEIRILFFSNNFRYTTSKKPLNKKQYAKQLLNSAGILEMMKKQVYLDYPRNSTEVIFTIKPEYEDLFEKFF